MKFSSQKQSKKHLNPFLILAHLRLQQDVLGDAAAIALQILRSVGENYLNEDFMYLDEIGIEDYCETSHNLLRQIIQNTSITQKLKEGMIPGFLSLYYIRFKYWKNSTSWRKRKPLSKTIFIYPISENRKLIS